MSHTRIPLGTIVVVLALLAGATPATAAPGGSASITGTVVSTLGLKKAGPDGIGDITVIAKRSTGELYRTTTAGSGRFRLDGLPAGTYGLKFVDRVGHRQCDGGCGRLKFYATEWLGDATGFASSEKITLKKGERASRVRAVIAERSQISGRLVVNGGPATDDVRVYARSLDGTRRYQSYVGDGGAYSFLLRKNDYKIKVTSRSGAFPDFFIVDPRDGDTIFQVNGVDKRSGLRTTIGQPQ